VCGSLPAVNPISGPGLDAVSVDGAVGPRLAEDIAEFAGAEAQALLAVEFLDPYHRVDVLDTGRRVRISLDGETLGETSRGSRRS
jgi:hypothetical protein